MSFDHLCARFIFFLVILRPTALSKTNHNNRVASNGKIIPLKSALTCHDL
jgi:hypothetical protein